MRILLGKFWQWYAKNAEAALWLGTFLLLLQVLHLFWLTSDVVLSRLTGINYFPVNLKFLLAIIDYLEIPALVSISLVYIYQIIKKNNKRSNWVYLLLLNSQWLHLFWITDEVIVKILFDRVVVPLPLWLTWLAIVIDYLEIPVMIDSVRRIIKLKQHKKTI